MEAMTPEEMRQALEDFQMTEEEILEQLDRTLAQLRQMQLEQMMENMLRQAERLAENQEEQTRAAESASDQRTLDSLARTEQALQKELNKLQEQAQTLSEKNQELKGQPQVDQFAQMAKQCQAGADMSDMTQQLQSGEQQSATQSGQKAGQKLRQMLAGMQQKLMEMRNKMSEEQLRALRDLTRRSLGLSEEQESMGDSTRAVSPQSLALRDMARSQAALVKGIEHLLEDFNLQAESNLFLSPQVRKHMKRAKRSGERATRTLKERNGTASRNAQYETMFSLNEATKSLMESLQNQSQCQGSCGNQSQMHGGMQSLSQQQLQLNQQSQSMASPLRLTPEEQGSIQRLSGQQQSIQAEMRDLANQFNRSRDRLGRLEEIAKSMDEVIEEMDQGVISDATLERQRNIYNRMLDFQKSLQRQDFENRRESRRGVDRLGPVPDPLARQASQGENAEARWERFKHEWYPPGFRALVKEYFESVTRSGTEVE
jgi:hypothetical protein